VVAARQAYSARMEEGVNASLGFLCIERMLHPCTSCPTADADYDIVIWSATSMKWVGELMAAPHPFHPLPTPLSTCISCPFPSLHPLLVCLPFCDHRGEDAGAGREHAPRLQDHLHAG